MFQRLLRLPRYYLLRIKRLKGDPEYLARGFAFGVFMGTLPLVPIQNIILIPLTIAFRISTITAIIAGTLVSNPLTFMMQYYLTWRIGNALLPGRISWEQLRTVLTEISTLLVEQDLLQGMIQSLAVLSRLSINTLSVLLTGGVILGIPAAVISYFFARKFFTTLRQRRFKRQQLNNTK
jgi:uncharacterized protein (DUF2062 family)